MRRNSSARPNRAARWADASPITAAMRASKRGTRCQVSSASATTESVRTVAFGGPGGAITAAVSGRAAGRAQPASSAAVRQKSHPVRIGAW